MSLNVIIVAVIALVILVVLIMIFASKTKFFSKTTSDCETKGGSCVAEVKTTFNKCPEGYVAQSGTCDTGKRCCAPFDATAAATK